MSIPVSKIIAPITGYNKRGGMIRLASRRSVVGQTMHQVKQGRSSKRSKQLRRFGDKLSHIMGEKKYWITAGSAIRINSTPSILSIMIPPQGDTDQSRDGDQCSLSSLEFNYTIFIPATPNAATGSDMYVARVVVAQWYPLSVDATPNPAPADILYTGFTGTASIKYLAPYHVDKKFEFRVLYDKTHALSAGGTSLNNTNCLKNVARQFITKFPHRKVQFNAGGTEGTNKLYVIFMTNWAGAGASTDMSIDYMFKVNFHDN